MWKEVFNNLRRNDLLSQAIRESSAMLEVDEQVYEASVRSLRQTGTADFGGTRSEPKPTGESGSSRVRLMVMRHLSEAANVDLAPGLVLVSVMGDIETIGEFSHRIEDLARQHQGRLEAQSLEARLSRVEEGVSLLLGSTVKTYKNHDRGAAQRLLETTESGIQDECRDIIAAITSGEVADLGSQDAAIMALYVRYLRRIAGSCLTILTSLVNPFPSIGIRPAFSQN